MFLKEIQMTKMTGKLFITVTSVIIQSQCIQEVTTPRDVSHVSTVQTKLET